MLSRMLSPVPSQLTTRARGTNNKPTHLLIPPNAVRLTQFHHTIVITDGTVGAGFKPARIIATPVVAPVVACTIAACRTGSWHQRQTDTYVNSAKRRQINPVSSYYCDNGRHRRGGFQIRPNHRRACCRPNHRRACCRPNHRRLCNWLLCLPSDVSTSGYSDYAIGSRGSTQEIVTPAVTKITRNPLPTIARHHPQPKTRPVFP